MAQNTGTEKPAQQPNQQSQHQANQPQNQPARDNPSQTMERDLRETANRAAGNLRETASRTAGQIGETASRAAEQAERWNANRSKPINTKIHGYLDYTLSPVLVLAPQAFGFPTKGIASTVPRAYGAASMIYSMLTRYELGVKPVLPMSTHLILDAVSSVFMAVSPWLMGFGRRKRASTWVPHLAFAATEMTIVALSDDRSTR